MNLYVGNIAFNTSESDLRNHFSAMGEVNDVKVITDRDTGRSRGFAFVTMDDAAGREAISNLNGQELNGRALVVNQARDSGAKGNSGGRGGYNNRY
ncbi:MAG: RNA-binding protein [Spirochaetales bacterium]|nr:RNA-binding protein [Spirochaetales bacterium]